jgi:hypothetical protein
MYILKCVFNFQIFVTRTVYVFLLVWVVLGGHLVYTIELVAGIKW